MRVFLTGGSGFIGRRLTAALLARGDSVVVLTRDSSRLSIEGAALVEGDPTEEGEWHSALAGCDAIIHLAGASIAGSRWTARQKQILVGSRVDSSLQLVRAIGSLPAAERPAVLVSASGIDYYPFAVDLEDQPDVFEDSWIEEGFPPGDSFLARMCRDWEREVRGAIEHGVRVVSMRTGLVLAADGGALASLKRIFRMFLGGRVGSGQQWMSWIHIADAVGGYLHALDTGELSGGVNLVAPNPVRNREFAHALGAALGRPSAIPTPAFALRLAVGELAEYLLHGRRARSTRLPETGYEFAFPNLEDALHDLFS